MSFVGIHIPIGLTENVVKGAAGFEYARAGGNDDAIVGDDVRFRNGGNLA